jgi:transmembrane sensor
MEVAVEDGSVAVTTQTRIARASGTAVLIRGDLASVSDAGVLTVKRGVDVDARLAWASGRLVFQNTPLRDALTQFNRWYDSDLRIGDSTIAEHPITAAFATESLSQAVAIMAAALDARVERDSTTITLYSRRHVR